MKKELFSITCAIALTLLTACGTVQPNLKPADSQPGAVVTNNQKVEADSDAQVPTILNAAMINLTPDESAALLFMREEEKLARDVYQTLYAKWKLQSFANIARSEQTHTDAIKRLMDAYKVSDNTQNQVGLFVNQDLQKLYSKLIAQGEKSILDALHVGATIEDLDIVDLQTRLGQTDKADIKFVYESLIRGSENHLRAFTGQITNYGSSYKPQYLSQAQYEAILSSSQRGGGARR
jgi:hypothetical protein